MSTELDAPAPTVWRLLKRRQTFLYVTRGALGIPAARDWPDEQREGLELRGRLWFLHVVPGWDHSVRIESVDEVGVEIRTSERGGPVEVWDHRLKVEPLTSGRSRYTDEIEVRAGRLTPAVWLFAHLFYRYRQARWRSLAKVVGGL